jgi:hypothetical protein
MSGGVLDIYSSLSLLYYTFLHHALATDYMNLDFVIMYQISTRNKRYNTFSDKLNTSGGLLGFAGFVVNLLNRPTDGTTVQGQKSATEKELLFVRLGVLWRTINLGRPVIALTSKCEAGIMFN